MYRFSLNVVTFAFAVLYALSSSAGWQDIGNGADVVICEPGNRGSTQKTYYVYDYYETFYRYKLGIYVPWVSADSVEIARRLLGRMPDRYNSIRVEAFALIKTLMDEAEFVESLPNATDSGLAYIGERCRLEQLVLQKEPSSPGEAYYRINKKFWYKLDSVQIATVMIHEALYRMAPETKKRYTSESIRHVVALLLSNSFGSFRMSESDEDRLLRDAGLIR